MEDPGRERRVASATDGSVAPPTPSKWDKGLDTARDSFLLHNFDIVGPLGKGSFGEVFEVRDRVANKQFAVKKSRQQYKSLRDRSRAIFEADTMLKLSKSNTRWQEHIIHLVSCWEEQNHFYMQMEYCSACLSEKWMNSDCTESDIWLLVLQMTKGLLHLHHNDVVHMDVKPSNYFVFEKEGEVTVKLGDFGLSLTGGQKWRDGVEGDVRYIAPELLTGIDRVDASLDIFSFGMSLYELVEGVELPSEGKAWRILREGGVELRRCRTLGDTSISTNKPAVDVSSIQLRSPSPRLQRFGKYKSETDTDMEASHYSSASTIHGETSESHGFQPYLSCCAPPTRLPTTWREMECLIAACTNPNPDQRPTLDSVEKAIEWVLKALDEREDESIVHETFSSPFSAPLLSPLRQSPSPHHFADKHGPAEYGQDIGGFDMSSLPPFTPLPHPSRKRQRCQHSICSTSDESGEDNKWQDTRLLKMQELLFSSPVAETTGIFREEGKATAGVESSPATDWLDESILMTW